MTDRSFKEYVKSSFFNELFDAVKYYAINHKQRIDFNSYSVSTVDYLEVSDITIKTVGIDDKPNMRIAFDVILEAEIYIKEYNCRHDNKEDTCYPWFIISCEGDLSKNLTDFRIINVDTYNQKNPHNKPLSDSLVPITKKEDLDAIASEFLNRNYPEALRTPMPIDAFELAKNMGLTIRTHTISEDFSLFGQICFTDCETELYDAETNTNVKEKMSAGTIIVDPKAFFFRNLGSINNTIVHECVHWDKHRKAFELERLYNNTATQIKCRVVGGVKDFETRSATDWMEWQANALAPKIQMPLTTFKTKAFEVLQKYKNIYNTANAVDVMEPVIDELSNFFVVSRQAAKIRMIDIGFEEAIGAFTYIDGKYVKPHAFKKGAIKRNQTYCISIDDAWLINLSDMKIREQTEKGAYIYVDSHICLNDSKYVTLDNVGRPTMTEYGRLHVDECCIPFDLKVKSADKHSEQYYTECVLFRDANSGIEFSISFSDGIDNLKAKADAILSRAEKIDKLVDDMPKAFGESLKYLMKWYGVTSEKLAADALIDPRLLQRMRNEPDYPKSVEPVVAVCLAMHLPPKVSAKLLEQSGFVLRLGQSKSHVMYDFFLNNYYMYSVADCNELLQAEGLPILTGKE